MCEIVTSLPHHCALCHRNLACKNCSAKQIWVESPKLCCVCMPVEHTAMCQRKPTNVRNSTALYGILVVVFCAPSHASYLCHTHISTGT